MGPRPQAVRVVSSWCSATSTPTAPTRRGPSSARSGREDHPSASPPGRSTTAMAPPQVAAVPAVSATASGASTTSASSLRAVGIWSKPNGLPESVTDRWRRSHEDMVPLRQAGAVLQPLIDEIREPHAREFLSSGARNARYRRPGGLLPAGDTRRGWQLPPERRLDAGEGKNTLNTPLGPLGKLPGSVWSKSPPEPLTVPAHLEVDHFAAFPAALVAPHHPRLVPARHLHGVR
jgi:hypothetical protein